MSFDVAHISARMAQVQARVAGLQSQLATLVPPSSGAGGFSALLDDALAGGGRVGSGASAALTLPATSALAIGAPPAASVGRVAPATADAPATITGGRAVEVAKRYLGTPYVWGAEHPSDGFDCSGLVQYVYKQLGVDLPRVSRDQARAGVGVASIADARAGDLIAFGSPVDHIGIYAGNNTMVVAPQTGDVVKVQQITRTPTAIRRVA